jgi:hypothetical protein
MQAGFRFTVSVAILEVCCGRGGGAGAGGGVGREQRLQMTPAVAWPGEPGPPPAALTQQPRVLGKHGGE